jgi:hypothetical protein
MITFNLPKAVYDTCFDTRYDGVDEYSRIICSPDVSFETRCKVDETCFYLAYGDPRDDDGEFLF